MAPLVPGRWPPFYNCRPAKRTSHRAKPRNLFPAPFPMDAVAFPPPPAPFLDDDFDFGDFTFASPAPQPATFDDDWGDFVASPLGSNPDGSAPATPPTVKSSTWEKLRAPLPLSLFGADDEDADEGPAEPPPPATRQQRVPSASSNGSKPADLKDLIAGLYGSQPPSTPDAAEASTPEADDDDGFGDGGWEFKTAPSAAGQDGIGRALEDGIEDVPKSLGSDQENWSSSTSVNEKLNHVLTTYRVGIRESTGQSVKAFSHSPCNNAAILDLFKESDLVDAVHVTQSSAESVQSSSDLFSNNEMNSSFETDENHSIKSTGDSIFIDFYHRLREESLTVISWHVNGLKEAQKGDGLSAENSEVTTIGKEIQEIYGKLQDFSLPKGCIEEHCSRDVCIDELVNSTKEEHLKDFEREYHLAEGITSSAFHGTQAAWQVPSGMGPGGTRTLASRPGVGMSWQNPLHDEWGPAWARPSCAKDGIMQGPSQGWYHARTQVKDTSTLSYLPP